MLRYIAFAMVLVSLTGAVNEQGAPTDHWTLARVINHGLQHAPRIQAVNERLKAASLRSSGSEAAYLPSLDFGASHGVARALPSDGESPYRSNFNLTLSQKIYDNGETGLNLDVSRIGHDRATLAALQAREQFVLDVASAFYHLCSVRLSLTVSGAKLKSVEKQRRALKQQVEQGFKTPRDLVRLDALQQRAQTSIIDAEAAVKKAVADLVRLSGIDGPVTAESFALISPAATEPVFPALPSWEQTFEARLAKFDDHQADKEIELLRRKNGPEVYVTAQGGYGASDYMGTGEPIYDRDAASLSAMVELKYNLWDGGRKSRDLGAALADKAADAATRRDTLAQLKANLDTLGIDRDRKLAALKSARLLMTMERQSYKDLETAYREGKTTYLDLVTALDSVTQAELSHDAAYFALLELSAKFRYYEGTTYETLAR